MSDEIPAAATAGQVARVVGVTERVVAGRKGDGRLPVLPNGRVDLHAVIRAGYSALSQRRGGGEAEMTAEERHNAAMRAAATITAHLVMTRTAKAGAGADPGATAAAALAEALDMLGVEPGEVQVPARLEPLPATA